MKGYMLICRTSHFQNNVRHATTRSSPFSMKSKMHLIGTRLSYEEKGDGHNRDTSHIRSPCPKISGPTLSLATLNNFSKPPNALALLSL
jgi:hypothetical protein